MPVPDSSGDWAGWLQSFLQNQGAAQPYGPGAAPTYGTLPGGTMPGGQVMGRTATTPGQPSMGYPAMGQAAGRPSVAPGMQQAAPWLQFGGFHPGNILQSHPPGSASLGPVFNASGSPGGPGAGPGGPGSAGNDAGFNNPYLAAAGANSPQGGPYVGSGPPGMPGPAPAGVGGPYVGGQGVTPVPGPLAGNQPSQSTGPINPSIIAGKRMAASPAATSTAAPSAAPAQSSRFTQVARPNAPASGYSSGSPMMTALDLSRLFGRG
jgi:hypothetical protein